MLVTVGRNPRTGDRVESWREVARCSEELLGDQLLFDPIPIFLDISESTSPKMRGAKVLLSALPLLLAAVCVQSGDVVTLTTSSFDDAVKNSKFLAVEFYAPW